TRRLTHNQRRAERAQPCHERPHTCVVIGLAPSLATRPHRYVQAVLRDVHAYHRTHRHRVSSSERARRDPTLLDAGLRARPTVRILDERWERTTPRLTNGLEDPRQRGLSPVPTCSLFREESRYKAAPISYRVWREMTSCLGLCAVPARVRIAAAVALGVALAPHPPPQSGLPRFEPTACWVDGGWPRDVRRECGWLVVPESRDRASTTTVRLAVEIFRAREPSGALPRVFLHGGPGGVGGIRLYSEGIARSPLRLQRDIVIYDQRGAGLSEPKLCPAYDTVAAAGLTEARRACIAALEAQGVDRRAYNTAASVADLIDLRRTLGYASWDVYAASYGARIVQEAMARDGRAIRAVVLASPLALGFSSQAEQPLSTQRALEHVFAACARQPSCRDAFPTVEQDFYAVYDDVTTSPVPVPIVRPDSGRDTVWFDGRRLVDDTRSRLLYRPRTAVARLPLLLHEL